MDENTPLSVDCCDCAKLLTDNLGVLTEETPSAREEEVLLMIRCVEEVLFIIALLIIETIIK